jgi:hypothetical protein
MKWVGKKWAENKNVAFPKILCEINALFFSPEHSIVNQELLPEGQTINAVYYTDIQEQLVKRMEYGQPSTY